GLESGLRLFGVRLRDRRRRGRGPGKKPDPERSDLDLVAVRDPARRLHGAPVQERAVGALFVADEPLAVVAIEAGVLGGNRAALQRDLAAARPADQDLVTLEDLLADLVPLVVFDPELDHRKDRPMALFFHTRPALGNDLLRRDGLLAELGERRLVALEERPVGERHVL